MVWRRRDWAIPVGRIRGIRLLVTPSWFLSAALIVILAAPVLRNLLPGISPAMAAVTAAALAVLLGLSVLAHELGHCFAALHFHIPVRQVRLYLIGGVSELGRSPATAAEESLVAAAGPAVSILLTAACWAGWAITPTGSVAALVMLELALANGIVAVFNLLPALPLDGGRVLRAAIWRVTGRRRGGTMAAVICGLAIAAALLVVAAVALGHGGRLGTLQAVIIAVVGFFVATGAWAEWPAPAPRHWPPGLALSAAARPVIAVPEGGAAQRDSGTRHDSETRPGGGAVLLHLAPDGRTVGVQDSGAGARAPIIPLEAEMMVLPGESPGEVIDRISALSLPLVALLDEEGRVTGVVMASDLARVAAARTPRP